MSFVQCNGKTAKDCWECNKYFSSHSSHYESYYNRRVVNISCSIGGNRTFEDNDDNTGKRLN